MLRQAVKLFLHKQSILSYSSFLFVSRHIRTLYHTSPKCKHSLIARTLTHRSSFRCIHSTLFCESAKKNIKSNSDKIQSGDSGNCCDNLVDVPFKHECEKNVSLKKGESEHSNCEIDGKSKLDISHLIENLSDGDDESYSDDDDIDELNSELVPYEKESLKKLDTDPNSSIVPANMYYKPKSIVQSLLEEQNESTDIVSSERDARLAELDTKHNLELIEKGELQIKGIEKVAIPPLTDIAPIINDVEVLKKLVQLGVDLSVVQEKGMIEQIIKMNFKKDVSSYIWFLKDSGVPAEKVGEVITKCPWIFQHDVHNLRVRIDYLRSKKFTGAQISNMLDRDPKFLLIPVDRIDAKLGFLQQEFKLTGSQIRQTVGSLSKLIIAKPVIIKEAKFFMRKFLGFTENELKTMYLTYPKIFLYDLDYIADKFDYLHNVMEIPHELIARTPQAMRKSRLKLESRHRFLVKCGRAQYDPTKPNYVSLRALITERDETWCFEVAKASVAEFNQFLRLI